MLLHRRRVWSVTQQKWMGWERKRGKLHELNRLLARRNRHDLPWRQRARRCRSGWRALRDYARCRHPPASRHRSSSDRQTGAPAQSTPIRCRQPDAWWKAMPCSNRGSHQPCRWTAKDRSFSASSRAHPVSTPMPLPYPMCTRISSAKAPMRAREFTTLTRSSRRWQVERLRALCSATIFSRASLPAPGSCQTSRSSRIFRRVTTWLPPDSIAGRAATGNCCRGFWAGATPPHRDRQASALPLISLWKMLDNLRRTLSAPASLVALLVGWTLPLRPAFLDRLHPGDDSLADTVAGRRSDRAPACWHHSAQPPACARHGSPAGRRTVPVPDHLSPASGLADGRCHQPDPVPTVRKSP